MACHICEQGYAGIYDFNCPACRTRYIQAEPCKSFRKDLVDKFRKRWGEFEGWQEGANCGCTLMCRRKATIREQSAK